MDDTVRPHVVAFIFARGGSKGVPRKNLKTLGGKPLIAWAIETARSSSLVDRVVVSTDDLEISEVARSWGAEVPFQRPEELARDDAPEWGAWQHALKEVESAPGARQIDVFLSVPPTAPLRSVQDIDACIDLVQKGSGSELPTDIAITVTEARRNPYFNIVCLEEDGSARVVLETPGEISRRQDAPIVYDMTTVAYAARPEFVRRASGIFDGRVGVVQVPRIRAIDIDTELDFRIAEAILRDMPKAEDPR